MKNLFERPEEPIWHNARLSEQQLFHFHFRSGSAQAVLSALRPYQNEDGGFGIALEPDILCVESQHALEILDTTSFGELRVPSVCNFLLSITTKEYGVPFVLPSVRNYPHAPW